MNAEQNNYWPKWYAGQQLRSDDLKGLEDYLISQRMVSDLFAKDHGIVSMDLDRSLSFSKQNGKIKFAIENVRGLTPSGCPVLVTEAISSIEQDCEESKPDEYDLWIALDDCGDESIDKSDKRTLVAEQIRTENHPVPDLKARKLYIGRYLTSSVHPRLRKTPWLYTLAGIHQQNPYGKDSWLSPLAEQLSLLLAQLDSFNLNTPMDVVLCNLITELAAGWQEMPITLLDKKIKLASTLLNRQREGSLLLSNFQSKPLSTESSTSDHLPPKLAEQLEIITEERDDKILQRGEDYEQSFKREKLVLEFKNEQDKISINFPQSSVIEDLLSIDNGLIFEERKPKALENNRCEITVQLQGTMELSIWRLKSHEDFAVRKL